jgi:predicted Zn-dependent protease
MRGSCQFAKGIHPAGRTFFVTNRSHASSARVTCQLDAARYRFPTPAHAMKAYQRLLFACLPLLALPACYEVPVTGRRALNLVDNNELTKVSMAMFEEEKRRARPSRDRARNEQLQRVGNRIAKAVFWDMPDADWEFVVFQSPEVNAFAMAGGKVGVKSGLYKIVKNDDQLAFVIAHEIAHVTAKHVHQRLSRAMAVSTVGAVGAIGSAVAGAAPLSVELLGAAYGIGTGAVVLAFDRAAEKEADYVGLLYMARAGYDPQEAVKVLEGLELESATNPHPSPFFSTHPPHPERILQVIDAMPKALAERAKSAAQSAPVLVK